MANWKEVAAKKRAEVLAAIPAEWVLDPVPSPDEEPNAFEFLNEKLPADVLKITSQSAVELIPQIASGALTSYEVTSAFCHRAAWAHQLTNCATEIFFDQALGDAMKLDEIYKETGKVVGPLHGIPISLKDQVNLKGIDTSIGYVAPYISDELQKQVTGRDKFTDVESLIAVILRKAGAIFYIKTTVPMAMMASDTTSAVYGTTVNSINRHFSPGGSSGGEGALVGTGGSIIGFGTDIGGSIRIPSAFNGIYGLRPSSDRIPYMNVANSMANQPVLTSVIGPMCRNLDDLKLVTKTIIDSEPWNYDPKVPPIPWREFPVSEAQKFSFGVLWTDKCVTPHPAFVRALGIVKKALESAGHDTFDFEPVVPHDKIITLVQEIFAADSLGEVRGNAALSDEPVSDVVLNLLGPPYTEFSVSDHWGHSKLKYEIQQQYNQGWLDTAKKTATGAAMDAFFSPSWSSTSYRVGRNKFSPSYYTEFVNGLDYSVVVIPVTTVDKEVDLYPTDYVPLNELDETNYKEYDPELFHGLPVCVQLITRKYQEEKAIALAQLVVELLKK